MSYRVVIADDEPLVLVGLSSMLDYEAEGFVIQAQARNGEQLENLIDELHPDIVITDIKMPVKTGLEVMRSQKEKANKPAFILLTSFEEFSLVKEAIGLDAVDYLVKLELTAENLREALKKAGKRADENKKRSTSILNDNTAKGLLQERFFIRQFFMLGDNATPLPEQISNLGLNLSYPFFCVCCIEFPTIISSKDKEKAISLYSSASVMVEETISRYMNAYTTRLDLGHIALTLCFEEKAEQGYRSFALSALKAARENLEAFFSLPCFISVGPLVNNIRLLSESFSKAQSIAEKAGEANPIIFHDHIEYQSGKEEAKLDFSQYRQRLKKAFEELDPIALKEGLLSITEAMESNKINRDRAIDITSNILYMVRTLLPDGEAMVDEIFPPESGGYHILYQLRNVSECVSWILRLADGLSKQLSERKQDYRMQVITRIQSYIKENVSRKLSLGEVADVFGYSQGYLSSIFTRFAGVSFVDYVTNTKIAKAKELLANPDARVYEVADEIGFDSSFYFSKVFKKVTGLSPSEYQQTLLNR